VNVLVRILVKFLVSMGIVCGFSVTVTHFFIRDETIAVLFGLAIGSLAPVVYLVLDELWD